MSITWTVITETSDELRKSEEFDSLVAATSHFHSAIGRHISNDDARAKDFRLIEHHYGEATVIDRYEFKGFFAPAPTEKDVNRPMYCPMCDVELDLFSDVEQWSDATIVYVFAGDSGNGPLWEEARSTISETEESHRVYCNHCGDTMPLDEWNEAYENRP